jgi:photosystem II stability/assembly factor-like uncharacterized protein
MRQHVRLWFAGVLLSVGALSASTQELVWERTDGPYGGVVHALLAIPDGRLYAGTESGIFRSTDRGDSWTAVGLPIEMESVVALAFSSTVLYAGTDGSGVFISSDGGDSWIPANEGLPTWEADVLGYFRVTSLAVADAVYAGIEGASEGPDPGGVYRSEDGGRSWEPTSLTGVNITSLAVSGAALYAAKQGSGVLRSLDRGETWTRTGLADMPDVTALVVYQETVYAVLALAGGVWRLSDDGESWMDLGLECWSGASLAVLGTDLYVGAADGVYRSSDGGESWVLPTQTPTEVKALGVLGTALYAGTEGTGILRSEDNGVSWVPVNRGLTSLHVSALAASDAELFAATLYGGVWRSSDAGESWVNVGLTNMILTALTRSDRGLYAGALGVERYAGGVFRFAGESSSWIALNQEPGAARDVFSLVTIDGAMLAASSGGVHRLDEANDRWTLAGLSDLFCETVVASGSMIYVSTSGGGTYRSYDAGKSWEAIGPTNLPAITAFAVAGQTVYAGTSDAGVFRSDDEGESWVSLSEGLPTEPEYDEEHLPIYSLALVGTTLYAGTQEGVFRLQENSWVPANTNLERPVHSLLSAGGYLHAGTREGVLRARLP